MSMAREIIEPIAFHYTWRFSLHPIQIHESAADDPHALVPNPTRDGDKIHTIGYLSYMGWGDRVFRTWYRKI